MAAREEIEADYYNNRRVFDDGLDDLPDHCDGEDGAPNMGSL